MYICLQCRSDLQSKEQPIVRKRGRPPGSSLKKIPVRLRKRKKVPLRRSGRRTKQVIRLQDESKVVKVSKKRKLESKRGRPKKVRTAIRKKRTERFFSYWLNGIHLSKKLGDDRVNKFQRVRYYTPLESSDSVRGQPKCHLCGSNATGSTLISCEFCKEWYHGVAYGVTETNADMVIGFRCHCCLAKPSPICPHTSSYYFPTLGWRTGLKNQKRSMC